MNLLDIAIICILALATLSGVHKGFLWSAASVVSYLLCVIIALLITPSVSRGVVANERVFNAMLYYTEGSEYIYDVEYSKTPISQISNAELQEIYDRSDVAYPMNKRIRENIENNAFSSQGITTLGDYFNQTMVLVTINILVFIASFALLRIAFAFALGWWNYAKTLPKLKKLDLPAAIGTGVIRGILALFMLFTLCPIVLTVLPFDIVENLIENSVFASFFYYSNILLSLIPGV